MISSVNISSDGEVLSKESFKYNERNDVIEFHHDYKFFLHESDSVRTNSKVDFYFTYKYDENDNWIERKTFFRENGKASFISKRQIEYYN